MNLKGEIMKFKKFKTGDSVKVLSKTVGLSLEEAGYYVGAIGNISSCSKGEDYYKNTYFVNGYGVFNESDLEFVKDKKIIQYKLLKEVSMKKLWDAQSDKNCKEFF